MNNKSVKKETSMESVVLVIFISIGTLANIAILKYSLFQYRFYIAATIAVVLAAALMLARKWDKRKDVAEK